MTTQEKLKTDVTKFLRDTYAVNGTEVKGQPMSSLQAMLRDAGWKGLGRNFDDQLRALGFKIGAGKGTKPGQRGSSELVYLA